MNNKPKCPICGKNLVLRPKNKKAFNRALYCKKCKYYLRGGCRN